MNKTFCVLPWIHMAIETNGNIKPCCLSTDVIKKIDGTPYNFGYDNADEILNSKYYADIRRKMLAGEKVTGCEVCYLTEESDGLSNRVSYNNYFVDKNLDVPNLEYLDIRLGSVCNLACRSCSPKSSSTLNKEIQAIPELAEHYTIVNDSNEWYETDVFKKNLKDNLSNIQHYYITGGEPTIIKQNQDLLRSLIDAGLNKTVSVAINTNLTNSNSYFYELLTQFDKLTVCVSVDGLYKNQEYLRYPSKWSSIHKNLSTLVELGIKIKASSVIQIGNLNTCVPLFEYFDSFNKPEREIIEILPIDLIFPTHSDIVYLPQKFKMMCWDRIEAYLNKTNNTELASKMASLKTKCFTDVDQTERVAMLNKYVMINKFFDKKRNLTLEDANPELAELLNDPSLWS